MAGRRKMDTKTLERKVASLLRKDTSAVKLSEELFGTRGVFAQAGKTRKQREALVKRPIFRQAQARLTEIQAREAAQFEADIAATALKLSGRLTVQIPKSLHAALKAEAVREGVSLAELMRLKLGFPYRDIAGVIAGVLPGAPARAH